MASEDRRSQAALALYRALQEKPYSYGFYEAVRRLDCVHVGKPRTGHAVRPEDEPVRFGQEPSMAFAASSLASFEPGDGRPGRLDVLFQGLLGPNGPLPLHLTEYARDRLRNSNDPTFKRFLDVFDHRMLALFYRSWASAQPTVNFDRPDADRFGTFIGSLLGIGMPGLRNRDDMPDLAKLHYAGHMSSQNRNAHGLAAILAGFFCLPVSIQECVGQWLTLPVPSRWRLGESEDTGTLGLTTVVGARVWETQQKFRIVFGALSFVDYERLLPGGDSLQRLVAVVRNYAGDQLNWDVNLILARDQVPRLELGRAGRLGWTSWLGTRPAAADADDLLLHALDYVP